MKHMIPNPNGEQSLAMKAMTIVGSLQHLIESDPLAFFTLERGHGKPVDLDNPSLYVRSPNGTAVTSGKWLASFDGGDWDYAEKFMGEVARQLQQRGLRFNFTSKRGGQS